MGSFDTTCCITGLAIHEGDPIRMGFVSPVKGRGFCYPGSLYQFWINPIRGKYNDYGNVDFESISEEDKKVVETYINLISPGLRDFTEYSYNVFDDNKQYSVEELWNLLVREHVIYDPNREKRKALEKWMKGERKEEDRPKEFFHPNHSNMFYSWMCHEWAWDKVLTFTSLNEEYKAELKTFLTPQSELFAKHSIKDAFLLMGLGELRRDGEVSGISNEIQHLIRYPKKEDSDFSLLYNNIAETIQFCHGLPYIRKPLFPAMTTGMQYEDFSVLKDWTELVAQNAAKYFNKVNWGLELTEVL